MIGFDRSKPADVVRVLGRLKGVYEMKQKEWAANLGHPPSGDFEYGVNFTYSEEIQALDEAINVVAGAER